MSGTIKFLNSNTALGNRVAVGVSSIVGPTGPKGDFGGPQGLQGPVGSGGGGGGTQGPQGLMGLQGYQGFIGATGPSNPGVQGFQGLIGNVGSTGSIGVQGLRGSTGTQGFQGLIGATGATGSIGPQGPIGGGGTGSSQWISSAGGIIYYSSGSVGIGKANPTGSLDVVGLVSISGALNMNGNVINSTFQNYKETVNLATAGTTYIVNCNTGNNFQITLTTGTTFSFINITPTGTLANVNLFLTQDTTGNRLITWPSSVSWGNPGAPVLSTTGGAIDIVSLSTFTGGSKWFGFLSGRGF
jgi:hypothetical protein